MVTEGTLYHVNIDFKNPKDIMERWKKEKDYEFDEERMVSYKNNSFFSGYALTSDENYGVDVASSVLLHKSPSNKQRLEDFEEIKQEIEENSNLLKNFKELNEKGKYINSIYYHLLNDKGEEAVKLSDNFLSPTLRTL